ncbi:hypothetical protein H6784_03290 [Candidatus Nomurabacteria bacterium]|nr:hypothetical protein [Candidatus Kaiserbacteria bacterium]MCB9811146.1 hypothetical protein [Candidatus Nomurabacteria bacterium]MCB9814417.1 hypothetical protein [Candidatus Nomurabacteria bacterium]
MEKISIPENSLPKIGDLKVVEGVTYEYVDSGYTLRSYYSHDGPGWDTKHHLANNEYSLKKFGRTFTVREAFDPQLLPETPYLVWKEVIE